MLNEILTTSIRTRNLRNNGGRGAGLILSLFPGIGLLDAAFEQAGYCVVRGPDSLWGGDIRRFHAPAGAFEGVIGGSPCQDFSIARRAIPPTGDGVAMLAEFVRVVTEARPVWWLLENVPPVPDVTISGYSWQRLDLNAAFFGSPQSRVRHFQFGDSAGRSLVIDRPAVKGAEGGETVTGKFGDFALACEYQGLPSGFSLPGFTKAAAIQAVANGVPLPMGLAVACAIRDIGLDTRPVCACGCGRPVTGRQLSATAACRKRLERRRRGWRLSRPIDRFNEEVFG